MAAPIRALAFVVNKMKSGAPELANDLLGLAKELGIQTKITDAFPIPEGYLKGCDACCVIGGDGTLLGIAAEATRESVPVIGVNRGSLGFLTTFSAEEARAQFASLLAGDFQIAYRSILECRVGGRPPSLALNDIVIKDGRNSHLVRLEVLADNEFVTDYYSDGLIFSTPTGSTAYNLSAGGPLIHPGAEVIAMTPICPHTLSNRSIIFHNRVCLKVRNRDSNAHLLVAPDGQQDPLACNTDIIEISLSDRRLPLVQRLDYSHFAVVRTKLKWSGGPEIWGS